jgi:hypothetical protein
MTKQVNAKKKLITSDEEYVAFYYELGKAITTWAHVEYMLFFIVLGCFDESKIQSLGVGFFSIDSFAAKLKYVKKILEYKSQVTANPDVIKDWDKLEKDMRDLVQKRNKLAHRQVLVNGQGKPGRKYILVPWIIPFDQRPKQSKNKQTDSICLSDIIDYRNEFSALAFSLMNFSNILRGQPSSGSSAQFLKSSMSKVNQMALSAISNHLRELLGCKNNA